MQLLLTLQGHPPLRFSVPGPVALQRVCSRRGHPAAVTVLTCRNSVESDLGHGSELECSPHMLQRGEGGFAGHSQLELKDLPCSEGSHRYRRKTAFQGRKGRDLLFE